VKNRKSIKSGYLQHKIVEQHEVNMSVKEIPTKESSMGNFRDL